MQYDTTDELYIVVYHIPSDLVTSCYPVVVVDSLVAIDLHEVVIYRQISIHLRGSDNDRLIIGKASCSLLDNSKGRGENLVELDLDLLQNVLLYLINFRPSLLTSIYVEIFDALFELSNLGTLRGNVLVDFVAQLLCAISQSIIAESLYGGFDLLDFLNVGCYLLEVSLRLTTKELCDDITESHKWLIISD